MRISPFKTSVPLLNRLTKRFSTSIEYSDTVFIKNLRVNAITGKDAWNRPLPQPLDVSIDLKTSITKAGLDDDLNHSLNYAVISRNVSEYMKANEHRNFHSLKNIAESVSSVVLDETIGGGKVAKVEITSAKSEIRADSINYVSWRSKITGKITNSSEPDKFIIRDLRLLTVIGIFTFERLMKQYVSLDITMDIYPETKIDPDAILQTVIKYVETANFKTVEALSLKVGQLITQNGVPNVTVRVMKPNAITFAEGVGVESTRGPQAFNGRDPIVVDSQTITSSSDFNLPTSESESEVSDDGVHTAFIAFGSNQGKQLENINRAIEELNKRDIQVIQTSSLYESRPMYYLDQSNFINGVLKVTTSLKPMELLRQLQDIESNALKRVKEIFKGPRSIDLDIILYDNIIMNTPDLIIPHIGMIERTFVLQPLCELVSPEEVHPVTAEPYHNHLKQLIASETDESKQESSDLQTLVPIPRLDLSESMRFNMDKMNHETILMGILNITPDSFSDGGKVKDLSDALERARIMVEEGARIIDIGGVSTRPGSKAPSESEEIDRVIPIIKVIRESSDPQLSKVLISVDTYRSKVAEESINAGADIINDISMGLYDEDMFEVIAKTGVPYVINHTRGTPETMSSLTQYDANTDENIVEFMSVTSDDSVLIKGISREIAQQLSKAFAAGVKKWQIILDPGIGFAKNLQQNLAILKSSNGFKGYSHLSLDTAEYISFNGCPVLLGPSRKRFIGTVTKEEVPQERVISTGATVMAAIASDSDIIRVHDVKDMKKVCLMGDALYRGIVN